MKKPIKYTLFVAGILGVAALYLYLRMCYSIPDKSLLSEPPPTEPEWQGIVPGASSGEEALQRLRTSPYVRRISISASKTEYPAGPTVETIAWDNKVFCVIPMSAQVYNDIVVIDGKVRAITIILGYDVTVDQVVSQYGIPERAAWSEEKNYQGGLYTAIYLLYPDRGMAFRCAAPYSTPEGVVDPEFPVTDVYYLDLSPSPSWLGVPPLLYINDPERTIDWPGYNSAP